MKECPNCSMELPDEAHYCPRCMFQYEKQEIQIKDRHRKRTSLLLIGSVFVIGVFICVPFVRSKIQDNMNNNYTEVDIKKIVNENFRTGENIIYDSEVENDLRDVLGNEFVDMKATLGEETDEMYHENGMDIYTFGMITVAVNQEGVIQDILIDYIVGENKKEYGVYGIAGTSDVGVVKTILGTPDQEYKKELCYRFDREFGLGLNINFSDDGMVEQLEYYYVQ